MNALSRSLTPLVPVFLLGLPGAAQTQEGTATCSTGVVPMCYGDHASCAISAPSEIDLYRFTGTAGDLVRIAVTGATWDFDPRYEILDPSGTAVLVNSCNAGCSTCTCSVGDDFILAVSGQYTILVSDAGANNTGSYHLDLQRVPPAIPDRFATYGVPINISLGHPSDHDFVAFEGARDDLIRVSVTGLSWDLDPAYALYDPSGSVVDASWCNAGCSTCTCSVVSDILTLPSDGRYHLVIHDAGWNNTGSVSVTVSCVLGICPPASEPLGTSYCATNSNSTGNAAVTSAWGSPFAVDETLFLYASDLPQGTVGIFFFGPNQAAVPLGDGIRCVGAPIYRFPPVMSCNRGELRYAPDFSNLPGGQRFEAGSTWNFQAWFRDGVGASNTSDGLSITFQ